MTHRAELGNLLRNVAAMAAAAAGLIHLTVINDHAGSTLLTSAFATIGLAQGTSAVALWRGLAWSRTLALVVHAAVPAVWVVTRTTGIPFIASLAAGEPVGVADVVATTFALVVLGLVGLAWLLRQQTVAASKRRIHAVRVVAAAGMTILLVPAILAPHTHNATAADDVVGIHHQSEPNSGLELPPPTKHGHHHDHADTGHGD